MENKSYSMTAKKKGVAKIVVLDTNVLLHDHNCLYNFQDIGVIIPIVVLEELDKFKKGSDQINYLAREFVRVMDKLAGEKLFTDGRSEEHTSKLQSRENL